jgi:hypothetical protein
LNRRSRRSRPIPMRSCRPMSEITAAERLATPLDPKR